MSNDKEFKWYRSILDDYECLTLFCEKFLKTSLALIPARKIENLEVRMVRDKVCELNRPSACGGLSLSFPILNPLKVINHLSIT